MSYWILKTEPSTYSFADLVRDGRTTWDGVSNPVALRNLREMHVGDELLIYHTGDEKAVVGHAKVVKAAFLDPKTGDPKRVVVDIAAGKPLARPVTLAEIKADPAFKELALVRQGRLSVVSVEEGLWKKLMKMGGE